MLENIYLGNIVKEKEFISKNKQYKYYEVIDSALLCYIEENNHRYAIILSGLLMGEKLDLESEYFVVNAKSLFELSKYQKEFDLNSLINNAKFSIGNFYTRTSSNLFILIRDSERILDIINNRDVEEEEKVISLSKYQKYFRH